MVHSLQAEMSLVSVKFEQNADSQKAQLDIGSVAVDSSMSGRGTCDRCIHAQLYFNPFYADFLQHFGRLLEFKFDF